MRPPPSTRHCPDSPPSDYVTPTGAPRPGSAATSGEGLNAPTRSRMSFIQQHYRHYPHIPHSYLHPACSQHHLMSSLRRSAFPAAAGERHAYSGRLLFALGFVQLVCGVALFLLNVTLYRFESSREQLAYWSLSLFGLDTPDIVRVTWLAVVVALTGAHTLLVATRATPTQGRLGVLFAVQSIAVLLSGALAILLSNSVIQHSVLGLPVTPTLSKSDPVPTPPTDGALQQQQQQFVLYFNIFMLCFSTVAFVISIVALSLLAHHLCSCALPGSGQRDAAGAGQPYRSYDANTWSKKERIIAWVMAQQSQLGAHKSKVITTIQRELTRTTTMTTTRTMTSQCSALTGGGHSTRRPLALSGCANVQCQRVMPVPHSAYDRKRASMATIINHLDDDSSQLYDLCSTKDSASPASGQRSHSVYH